MAKRKHELSSSESDDYDSRPSAKTALLDDEMAHGTQQAHCSRTVASHNRSIRFNGVQMFYFEREQGNGCIPSYGGCTIGMAKRHYSTRRLTFAEHRADVMRHQSERSMLLASMNPPTTVRGDDDDDEMEMEEDDDEEDDSINDTESTDDNPVDEGALDPDDNGLFVELDQDEDEVTENETQDAPSAIICARDTRGLEPAEPTATFFLAESTNTTTHDWMSANPPPLAVDEQHDDEEEPIYLQPLNSRERTHMLESCGVEVDAVERESCHAIRTSRQVCGCDCLDGMCEPDTCECALDGIKCQSDRATFPCACNAAGCDNAVGRVAFNIQRVRAHFVRTVMRLKRERIAEDLARHYAMQDGCEPPEEGESTSPTTTTSDDAHETVSTRASVGSSTADSSNDSGFDDEQQLRSAARPQGIQRLLAQLAEADGKPHAHTTSCIEVDAHGNTMGTFVCQDDEAA